MLLIIDGWQSVAGKTPDRFLDGLGARPDNVISLVHVVQCVWVKRQVWFPVYFSLPQLSTFVVVFSDGGAPGPGGHPGGGDPWGMTNTSLPGGSYPSSSMLPSSAQYTQASSYPMGHRDSMVSICLCNKTFVI